jgi:predicted metal-binding membrane protein
MAEPPGPEPLPRRDRAIVIAGLAAVCLLAWLYLVHSAHDMGGADMAAMPGMVMTSAWSAREAALTFAMWAVMMAAMMLPSAAPMTLLFAAINGKRAAAGTAAVPTAIFVAGYLATWTTFAAAATLAQWALQRHALLASDTRATGPLLGGALLVAAGLYQLTPAKYACLSRCRSPFAFIMSEWRDGRRGALVMGVRHGALCVGCCWALMALLFAVGVMNLLWVAAIAAFVLVEKLAPAGRAVGLGAGAVLIAWGLWVATRGV